jgi:hypothetical protein
MSRLTIGILGTIALSLSVGAAQLALGHDLSGQDRSGAADDISVNRSAKTDRAVKASVSSAQTRTIALRLSGFSDTSFLVRVPMANRAGSPLPPSLIRPGHSKAMVACEPAVSMLTEVAKRLQPGRCVT